MNKRKQWMLALIAAASVFGAGSAFGAWQESRRAPTHRFGQPKTILQVSLIKWRASASDEERQSVLDGVKRLAGQVPGIKNIWMKPLRMQPRNFNAAFVIEFESREAADNYADHPAHEAWSKQLVAIREDSISPQIGN